MVCSLVAQILCTYYACVWLCLGVFCTAHLCIHMRAHSTTTLQLYSISLRGMCTRVDQRSQRSRRRGRFVWSMMSIRSKLSAAYVFGRAIGPGEGLHLDLIAVRARLHAVSHITSSWSLLWTVRVDHSTHGTRNRHALSRVV